MLSRQCGGKGCHREAVAGKQRCQVCLGRSRAWYRKQRRESKPPGQCTNVKCEQMVGEEGYKTCEPCRVKQRKSHDKYRDSRRMACRNWNRKQGRMRKYGLSAEALELLLSRQACDACGLPFGDSRTWNGAGVDHDHRTGKVRGLLHKSCNSVLGFVSDSPHRLRCLLEYLERNLETSESTVKEVEGVRV